MTFTIDTEKLTASQKGGGFFQFKNLQELLAFLVPPGWGPDKLEDVWVISHNQTPHSETAELPSRLFCKVNGFGRARLSQLVAAGKVIKNGKLYCWKDSDTALYDDLVNEVEIKKSKKSRS